LRTNFTEYQKLAKVFAGMLSQFLLPVPALLVISDKRAMEYTAAALLLIAGCWCFFSALALFAWFRKPIESAAGCPKCGSKDFRPSHDISPLDRIRKRIGIFPFRCRGCTKRFFSRSSRRGQAGIPSEALSRDHAF
jgi:hypothetical protein